jgi:hypothetical protein
MRTTNVQATATKSHKRKPEVMNSTFWDIEVDIVHTVFAVAPPNGRAAK